MDSPTTSVDGSGWSSLSGFIEYKQGGGSTVRRARLVVKEVKIWSCLIYLLIGLGRLMFRRRLWFVLDDLHNSMLAYRNRENARPGQTPSFSIDLQSAGIFLNPREKNQFIIIVNEDEHQFTADNYESSMIWLLALQSLRNRCSRVSTQPLAIATAAAAACFMNINRNQNSYQCPEATASAKSRSTSSSSALIGMPRGKTPLTSQSQRQSLTGSMTSYQRLSPIAAAAPFSTTMSQISYFNDESSASSGTGLQPPAGCSGVSGFDVMDKKKRQVVTTSGDRRRRNSLDSGIDYYTKLGRQDYLPLNNRVTSRLPSNDQVEKEDEDCLSLLDDVLFDPSDRFDPVTALEDEDVRSNSGTWYNGRISGLLGREVDPVHRVAGGTRKNFYSDDMMKLNDEIFLPLFIYNNSSNDNSRRYGRLESTDSVLDQSCSQHELVAQLVELEQQLISSKCEMAKLLNKETCFKEMLEDREKLIRKLDSKIEYLESHEKNKASIAEVIQSQIRELQDQTQFLSREIRHLARLRHFDHQRIRNQNKQVGELTASIETWKDNYVYLLQSCITIPTGDVTDGWQLKLFGGDIHRYRVQELLTEARQSNPTLPEYNWLMNRMSHVDQYGFRHVFDSEGLLLHYICQQLHIHYRTLYPEHEASVKKWTVVLSNPDTAPIGSARELKSLCRQGIPAQFRGEVWKRLVYAKVADVREEKGIHYYSHLVTRAHDSMLAGAYRKQIHLDLMRTMPNNINFNSADAEGIRRMKEVLQAFSIHNPDVGYCQGLNFITAMCLLFLDTEDAFWALVAITEKYFSPTYFDRSLTGAQVDQEVLKELLSQKLPTLYDHFVNVVDIELSTITLNWFLAIFYDIVPFQTLLYIWDCFLLEGPKVLFRVSIAIMQSNEANLLEQHDTISIMRYLKACTKLLFDVEGTIKTAFQGLKPFPHRNEITAKQAAQRIKLNEKMKHRLVPRSRSTVSHQSCLEMEMSLLPNAMHYECAIIGPNTNMVWLFLGCQKLAKVNLLDCIEGISHPIDIQFDSQVQCACAINDLVLATTLSRHLYAFCYNTYKPLWRLMLNDIVLSLCCRNATDSGTSSFSVSSQLSSSSSCMLYAGLADGTIAVVEKVQSSRDPSNEELYIPIGRSAVTSCVIIGDTLWAACGNTIHILNSTTLDTLERVMISHNPLDYVHTMSEGELGVWLAVKGSSILELWDTSTRRCKKLFDVYTCQWIQHRQEEDSVNQHRITCLLPVLSSVWVGTGDGNLHIFDCLIDELISSPASDSPQLCSQNTKRRGQGKVCLTDNGKQPSTSSSASRRSRRDSYGNSRLVLTRTPSKDQDTSPSNRKERRLSKLNSKSSIDVTASDASPSVSDYHAGCGHQSKNSNDTDNNCNSSVAQQRRGMSSRQLDIVHQSDRQRSISAESSQKFQRPVRSDVPKQMTAVVEVINRSDEGKAIRPVSLCPPLIRLDAPPAQQLKFTENTSNKRTAASGSSQYLSPAQDNKLESSSSGRLSAASQDTLNIDIPFNIQLILQSKVKISERPVKCLVRAGLGNELVIISCAGYHGDDEPILTWRKDVNQASLWTNEPVREACPLATKARGTRLSPRHDTSGCSSRGSTSPREAGKISAAADEDQDSYRGILTTIA